MAKFYSRIDFCHKGRLHLRICSTGINCPDVKEYDAASFIVSRKFGSSFEIISHNVMFLYTQVAASKMADHRMAELFPQQPLGAWEYMIR